MLRLRTLREKNLAAVCAQREQITDGDEEELIVDKVGVPLIFLGMALFIFVVLPAQSII